MKTPKPDTMSGDHPGSAVLPLIDAEWPSVAVGLADLDSKIRALTTRHRVSALDVRRTRRAGRRLLRERLTTLPLGLCESCRRVPATQRVMFADLVMFATCSRCAAGAIAEVAA